MDDDPDLRSLEAELERDDPALAALLSSGSPAPHHHVLAWLLLAAGLLTVEFLLPIPVAVGVTVILLVAASPFAALWLLQAADDVRPHPQP